ncbi:MAG: hypothetical protein LBG57_05475 [Treponema sp.]|jgi:hypothetical protein|nr:hypothetical protein [Treponema sp.]
MKRYIKKLCVFFLFVSLSTYAADVPGYLRQEISATPEQIAVIEFFGGVR